MATPIGNLEDITLRALRILKEVDVIACEDTRVTKKLLARYEVSTPTVAFHQHSREADTQRIVDRLAVGEAVALVTDAGTPSVSDPGRDLVESALKNGVQVVPIPGVSAVSTLVSVAGAPGKEFCFFGFVPHKKGRETFMKRIAEGDFPVVYYDSPHRLVKNLELLQKFSPEIRVVVGREMTKMHEEFARGSVEEVLEHFRGKPSIKGECSVIVWK